jgi:hypothetical protein
MITKFAIAKAAVIVALLNFILPCAFAKPPTNNEVSKPAGVVDRLQVTGQTLEARGWAGSGDSLNPVVAIRILFDDIEVYKGDFKTNHRPDVARVKGNPAWLQSGWSIKNPLQDSLSEGNKKITAAALLKNGESFAMKTPIEFVRISQGASALKSKAQGHLDEVKREDSLIKARGWAASGDPYKKITAIILKSGEEIIYRGAFQVQERQDVATALGNPALANCGWLVETSLPIDKKISEISVEVEVDSGEIIKAGIKKFPKSEKYYTGNTPLFLIPLVLIILIIIYYSNIDIHFCVILSLGIVLALSSLIIIYSKMNAHPDEKSHLDAVDYYSTNFIKKRVDSPEMIKTIIPGWGVSYLHLKDCTYFIISKISVPFSWFTDNYIAYRFSTLLLLLFLFYIFRKSDKVSLIFLSAVCLSPQVWYVFSYINGDAFSLMMSLLACYYFVIKKTIIIDYFKGNGVLNRETIVFFVLCVTLSFTRLHYFIVIPFIITILVGYVIFEFKKPQAKLCLLRFLGFLVLFGLTHACNFIWDEYVNDFSKKNLLASIHKDHKHPRFTKEYILASDKNPEMRYAKEYGISYQDVIFKTQWFEKTLRSFIGTYGFMNKPSSPLFYRLHIFIVLVPICIFYLTGFYKSSILYKLLLFIGIIFIALTIIQSTFYSWTYSFQAQGRYVFAIIPIAVTIFALRDRYIVSARAFQLWLIVVLILNIYGYFKYAFEKFSV